MTARRFPIGLTLATAVALAILCGLGTWQLKRLAWKQDLLARIESARTAVALPVREVLARADRGEIVDWTRVSADCAPSREPSVMFEYALDKGEIVWRATAYCLLDHAAFRVVTVDLGILERSRGQVERPPQDYFLIQHIEGVLAPISAFANRKIIPPASDGSRMAPFVLVAETASPRMAGVRPAPIAADIPNRHLEYALTWFGLAGALAAVYAALLRRRLKAP